MLALLAIPAVRNGLILLAVFAAIVGGIAFYGAAQYKRGAHDTASAIKTQDDKAVSAAQKAVQTVDECFNAGRNWDQVRGVCGE